MARIKKAQQGISCRWSKGERVCGKPLGEKVRDMMWDMKLRRDERKIEKSNRKTDKESTKKASPPGDEGYERDFPGDISPGGFKGDPGGKRGSRWRDEGGKMRMVGSMKRGGKLKSAPKKKLGGKLAKQAATAIAMKKKGIKPKKSK